MLSSYTDIPEDVGSQETLGQRIRALRKQARLTQEDVARAMGISRSAVAHWETNREGSVRDYLPQLAKLLDVPVEVFLNGMATENVQMVLSIDEVDLLKLYRELNVLERLAVQRSIVRLMKKRDQVRPIGKRGRKPAAARAAELSSEGGPTR